MRRSFSSVVAVAGVVIAAAALLWPMRAHHAMWAVTVGTDAGGTQANYVAVGGGELRTPLQLLFEGTSPEESQTRSALRGRLVVAVAAGAVALIAGLVAVRHRRPG